jgi:hypothetical protein|tara:strand:- start:161 stop:937 length:777 start_codon:yes stop_codon:yes gene_type:complete
MGEQIFIDSTTRVELTDLKDATDDSFINDAVVHMSLFKETPLNPEQTELVFTSGGVAEPAVGDIIEGATGGATAVIDVITLTSGTWAGGDAAGYMSISRQFGSFEAENLDTVDQANIATIAADSSCSVTADGGDASKIHVRNHGLVVGDVVRVQGTRNIDGQYSVTVVIEDYITFDATFVEERFTGNEEIYVGIDNGIDILLEHVSGDDDGHYDGALPSNLIGLVNDSHYYRYITIVDGTHTVVARQRCRAVYYLDVD